MSKHYHEVNGRNVTTGFADIRIGDEYNKDQLDFLKALDQYKRVNHRPHPTYAEILAIVRSLGYRKVQDDGRTIAGMGEMVE